MKRIDEELEAIASDSVEYVTKENKSKITNTGKSINNNRMASQLTRTSDRQVEERPSGDMGKV